MIRFSVGLTGARPCICLITCGSTSTPSLAMALYIAAICIGVTLMPWPIGMLPIDEPYQSSTGSTEPACS